MSHSVFRDLDDDKNCGNSSKTGVADNNLIVFIHKGDDVQVDPNALQDFIGKSFSIRICVDLLIELKFVGDLKSSRQVHT